MTNHDTLELGREAEAILDALARFSEPGPGVTRLYMTAEHRAAVDYLDGLVRAIGMTTRLDDAGTLRGRLEGANPQAPALILGSHIDSVRSGGRYDGTLGVVAPLLALRVLKEEGTTLPFPVELVAFGDEEGSRFAGSMLGSRSLAGTIKPGMLDLRDADGMTMREAIGAFGLAPSRIAELALDPSSIAGFVEVHIEQGPALERDGLPLSLVTSIAASERWDVVLEGKAGHAGTVPMGGRQDSLAGAAACILAVEQAASVEPGAVGTVGKIEVAPGSVNVIPGATRFTVDVRAPTDEGLSRLTQSVRSSFEEIAADRQIAFSREVTQSQAATPMSSSLSAELRAAMIEEGQEPRELASGAGHDAMIMTSLTDAAMLFVRCRDGLSHHPDEFASAADMGIAIGVLVRFLRNRAAARA